MSNEYKDWLEENEKENKLKQSRIDLIGQNGNEGLHYDPYDKDLYIQKLEERIKELEKIVYILRSDLSHKQDIVDQHVIG